MIRVSTSANKKQGFIGGKPDRKCETWMKAGSSSDDNVRIYRVMRKLQAVSIVPVEHLGTALESIYS